MPGIVLDAARLVYWPVPKNACSAIKGSIVKSFGLSIPEGGVVHDAAFTWTLESLPGHRDIALVRHPLARLHSLWVNKIAKDHPLGSTYDKGLDTAVFGRWPDVFRSEMPFEEFTRAVLSIPPSEADPHWATQDSQIPKGAEIFRMEQLGDLLRLLLPRVNPGHLPEKDWRKAYPPDLLRLARYYYWADLERFGFCRTILIDLDGVLTDGKFHMDHSGEKMFKSYHTRDIRAIRELTSHGWEVVIVTADDWEGVFHFAEKVGAVVEVERDKRKLLERYLDFVAIGDDVWDVPLLKQASRAFAPMDADPSVLGLDGVEVLDVQGGHGVVARVLSQIIGT